jgi:hypothetical protein
MKRFTLILLTVLVVGIFSCKKKDDPSPQVTQTPLSFASLVATDTVIVVNGATKLTANTTGDGLTYTWSCAGGYNNFTAVPGTTNSVIWTICHADRFLITCEAKDQYGLTQTKTITIRSHD